MTTFSITIDELPLECIEDCSAQGSVDAAVEHWLRDELVGSLIATLDVDAMRCCLHGYGAWDDDDLMDEDANRARILWLACCTFSEYIMECEDAGIDPLSERPDDFDPSCGSDIFVLE